MTAGEAEVVDYIDLLLGDAPGAAAASATTPAAGAGADLAQADGATESAPVTTGPHPAADEPPVMPAAPCPDAHSSSALAAAPDASGAVDAPGASDAIESTPTIEPTEAPATPATPSAPVVPPAPAPQRAPRTVQADPPAAPVQMAHAPRWLRVVVDGASYALELLRVQEVVRLMPIVPMRGAQPAVLGVMNLRGRIVPVFDLGLWLGTGRVQAGEHSRIVVVERDDELIGLLVSAVEDVVTLGRDRIEPPLPGDGRGVVLGVARVGAVPTVLFDAYALYG